VKKELTVQEFDEQWNPKDHSPLVTSIFREVLTQKDGGQGTLFLIQLAIGYTRAGNLLRGYTESRYGPLVAEVKNLKRGLRLIQISKHTPIEIAKAIGATLESVQIEARNNTEKTKKLAQQTNNPERFLKALVVLDLRSTNKPTIYLKSSFISLLARHFRRSTSRPNFLLVERIVRAIFGGDRRKVSLIGQLERNFNAQFPNWSKIMEQISKDGTKAKFGALSAP